MTKNEIDNTIVDLNAELATLIKKFGTGKIVLATLKAYFQTSPRPPDADHLSNHLKRDIGVPENRANPGKTWWGMRF